MVELQKGLGGELRHPLRGRHHETCTPGLSHIRLVASYFKSVPGNDNSFYQSRVCWTLELPHMAEVEVLASENIQSC